MFTIGPGELAVLWVALLVATLWVAARRRLPVIAFGVLGVVLPGIALVVALTVPRPLAVHGIS